MARQDWGALQKQFLAEHARTGISPKAWCEEQGLKYSTAKDYIKIKGANSEKKIPNKTPNSEIRKTSKKPITSSASTVETPNSDEGEPTESAGILKPQHEQFAQNIAQGMPRKLHQRPTARQHKPDVQKC
ncbi:hypothetical protein BFS14_14590 [Serratia fonticola]|uniref:hypothetical protein n=1 Tax=Serratia fonticola TaxID=47917 RepID=UPI0008FD1876|nr:hypothetical protein BFS14_14590 [Serratia fonticola]